MIQSQLPPQDLDIEAATIGAILMVSESIDKNIDKFRPEIFYSKKHEIIVTAINQIYKNNGRIDILTVSNKLKETAQLDFIGGTVELSNICNTVSSDSHLEFHLAILTDLYIKRQIINLGSEIQAKVYTDDSEDIFSDINAKMNTLNDFYSLDNSRCVSDILKVEVDKIEKLNTGAIKIESIPSGLNKFDKFSGGFQSPDLMIIAARPSMGKTSFALQLFKECAQYGVAAAFFSLEMSSEQLCYRFISSEADISFHQLRSGQFAKEKWSDINRAVNVFANLKLYIDDEAAITIEKFKSKAYRLVKEKNVKVIFLDYLQLMRGKEKMREQEISNISRGLKEIAKQLNICIVALAQLNRNSEARNDKRPMLSDLRDSGSIEQDADIVCFLHRVGYYDKSNMDKQNILDVIFAKNRNGAVGEIELHHNEYISVFSDNLVKWNPVVDLDWTERKDMF
jgi:replicative DNA helicase